MERKVQVTQDEYNRLCKEIHKHNQLYFEEAHPIISDAEYDLLLQGLEEIESKHPEWITPFSPTQRVGEKALEGFQEIQHSVPMLSLEKAFTREDIEAFHNRVCKLLERKDVSYCLELKMDGLAMSAIYENAHYVRAVTRGDGRLGSDVTRNVKVLHNLPLMLSSQPAAFHIELRAEVFIPKSAFEAMNREREELGLPLWANPRNAAAGSIKLLNPQEVAKRSQLSIIFYAIVVGRPLNVNSQYEVHQLLHKWGLPTLQSFIEKKCPGWIVHGSKEIVRRCNTIDQIVDFASAIEKVRDEFPFEIDGIVIKVDDLLDSDRLGNTVKHPRSAIAYKFSAQQAWTKVVSITAQVGRTGVITPVAEVEPIILAGSTVARATLHNEGEIRRKDIRVGDTVCMEKGGDVIPKIVRVDIAKRNINSTAWHMPELCPSCNTRVIRDVSEAAWRCPNIKECPQQILRRLIHCAGKEALDIEHLGEKVMEQLVSKGFVKQGSDLFALQADQLNQLEGFKAKSVDNLLQSIQNARSVSFSRFIMALGIRYVGMGTAENLALFCHDLSHLMKMQKEDLLKCTGVGQTVAQSISAFFADAYNQEEVRRLHAALQVQTIDHAAFIEHPLYNKTVVLTGSLSLLSRHDACEKIKRVGGRVSESVGKKTDFLIVGENPGSKLEKARLLSISILTEREFLALFD